MTDPILVQIVVSYAQHAIFLLAATLLIGRAQLPQQFQTLMPRPGVRKAGALALALVTCAACAWFTRGWFGELSLTNTAWALSTAFAITVFRPPQRAPRWLTALGTPSRRATAAMAVLACGFYASALALVPVDVYAWGYTAPFAGCCLALAFVLFFCGAQAHAWLVLAAVVLWAVGVRHSANLFDLLFDVPLLVAVCIQAFAPTRRQPPHLYVPRP